MTLRYCKLHDQGLIKICGNDAQKLLQNQLTCDVSQLQAGHLVLAAQCNVQGRVLNLGYLGVRDDCFYWSLPLSTVETAIRQLQKYAIFFSVKLENVSTQYQHWGLLDSNCSLPTLALSGKVGSTRQLLVTEQTWNPYGQPQDTAHWHIANIQAGIPRLLSQHQAQFLPHKLRLEQLGAISLNKGCYIGQEIISRMHHLAKVKQHSYYLTCQSLCTDTTCNLIYDSHGQRVGEVINYQITPSGHSHLLAQLTDKACQQPLFLDTTAQIPLILSEFYG